MYTAIKLHHPEPEIEDKSGNNLLMTKKFVMISKLKSSRNLKLIIMIALVGAILTTCLSQTKPAFAIDKLNLKQKLLDEVLSE